MNRYDRLIDRIGKGERVLIDGATGTEIERRGVPQLDNAWNGGGALSHPDVLRTVHEDYIRQGAEIVISNSFATSRHALRDAGGNLRALGQRGFPGHRDRLEHFPTILNHLMAPNPFSG